MSDAAIDAIDVRLDEFAYCIFRDVLVVHVEDVFTPALELLSTCIEVALLPLQ